MREIWADVKGYEGLYKVSTDGRIRSLSHYAKNNINGGERLVKGVELKTYKMPNGYHQVQLSRGRTREKKYVHRLVAIAFLPNDNDLSDVNHIDGNKNNNDVRNLEWVSHKDNQIHMVKNMLTRKATPIINIKSGCVYRSLAEAEKETGIKRHFLRKACEIQSEWRFLKNAEM